MLGKDKIFEHPWQVLSNVIFHGHVTFGQKFEEIGAYRRNLPILRKVRMVL